MATTELGAASAEWHKYWPLVAATAMSLAALLSSGFGVMLEPLQNEFGWARAQISSGPAVVSIMGLVLATPAGIIIDQIGARRCGILVVLISVASIAAMSAIGDSLWHWWAAWALFGIAGAFTSTVWLAPVLAEYFAQNHGWRSGFLALAALWFVLTIPLVLAFVPSHHGSPKGAGNDDTTARPQCQLTGLTPREGFASPIDIGAFVTNLKNEIYIVRAAALRLERLRKLARLTTAHVGFSPAL